MGHYTMRIVLVCLVFFFALPTVYAESLPQQGHAILLRHALAPGTGDPSNFTLNDCSTQRNLNSRGRDQSRAIGAWLREQGAAQVQVYSSQWCRCLETAELLGMGAVRELPALNSFFQRRQDRGPNLRALGEFFAIQPLDGDLIVLVTHQVTVTAQTGIFPSSGEGVLLKLNGTDEPEVLRRFDFGW